MRKIYESGTAYVLANWLVKKVLYLYYDEIIISGKENIPQHGRFIFAPNHRNALMDALAILLITPKRKTTSFLARSDVFKNKNAARFLHFAKIMPAFRMRDGYENLSKNNEVFDNCKELLEKNHTLCIMPEGNQEMEHRVRPLVKGIFRIAFSMNTNESSDLSIVPVGLDYGNIIKYGKHLIIEIGKPIPVGDYADSYVENPSKTINDIKSDLKLSLEKLCLHIPSEEFYDTVLDTIHLVSADIIIHKGEKVSTYKLFQTKNKLADKLNEEICKNPDKIKSLAELTQSYKSELKKFKIHSRNVEASKSLFWVVFQAIMLMISLPLAFAGFLVNVLPFFTPVYVRKRMKIEYEGFFSSVQFVAALLTFPVFYSFQAVLILLLFSLNPIYFPFLVCLFLLLGKLSFYWYSQLKNCVASFRFAILRSQQKQNLKQLKNRIFQLVSQ